MIIYYHDSFKKPQRKSNLKRTDANCPELLSSVLRRIQLENNQACNHASPIAIQTITIDFFA